MHQLQRHIIELRVLLLLLMIQIEADS